jgi:hypothetical protein
MIREDELVTTRRVIPASHASPANVNPVKPTPDSESQILTYSSPPYHVAELNEPGRIQIRLVSAELARRNAASFKTGVNAHNDGDGVLAFEGEFISGNTTLVIVHDCIRPSRR